MPYNNIVEKKTTTILVKNLFQTRFVVYNFFSFAKTNLLPLFSSKYSAFHLYGKVVVLRLYGIGFSASIEENQLFLKLGLSMPISIKVPENISTRVKLDDRKKPNIIWLFSSNSMLVSSFAETIKTQKILSIFVRKRITGILYLNELSTYKFKKWKDKRKKRK